MSAKLTLT